MRNLCTNVLSASDHLTTNGSQVNSNQIVSASWQADFGDATAAGTLKIQASNDPFPYGNLPQDFTVINWVNIPNATANVTSGGRVLITIAQMCYQWVRAVYTTTAAGVQVITAVADVGGSLNSTYYLLNSGGSSPNNYYVWFNVDGGGVDPAVSGRTGIEVDIAEDDTADTIGAAMVTAVAAANTGADFTAVNSSGAVTVTNKVSGPFVAASDHNTGFTFAVTGGGTSTINVTMNALSI